MTDDHFHSRLKAALEKATAALLAERNGRGFWEGELSHSALATATAVTALAVAARASQISNHQSPISAGLKWLAENQNADGGWGDTTKSLSNISTTTLCWAAFGAAGADGEFSETVRRAEGWLNVPPASCWRHSSVQKNASKMLAARLLARYGKDHTFSVPILTMCALAGRLGEGREAWRHVIPLPFELAACPHQLFAALRLPVVSYALPALIAIGQARHVHAPSRNPLARMFRNATREKTLRKLTEIQPENGGFLEATPLTSFVTMSLAASGQAHHVVTQRGLEFLLQSQRADGSWPIDTNLSTWCTTLAIDALPSMEGRVSRVPDQDRGANEGGDGDSRSSSLQLVEWLLRQQYTTEHPYTHAAPGGWAWTDLPGGVPDADDTAGALLALAKMGKTEGGMQNAEMMRAAEAGIRWLLDLQNRDGGIPTFCRGWGALPFDRSSPDITAHAVRAWLAWRETVSPELRERIHAALQRAIEFLAATQDKSGSWTPLWFGNQFSATEENLTYGTARVLQALQEFANFKLSSSESCFVRGLPASAYAKAIEWFVSNQQQDGSWGGSSQSSGSIEETALAVLALGCVLSPGPMMGELSRIESALHRGTNWLLERVESGAWREPSPIGFYFAKLWYFERLYPLIFTVGALRAVSELET